MVFLCLEQRELSNYREFISLRFYFVPRSYCLKHFSVSRNGKVLLQDSLGSPEARQMNKQTETSNKSNLRSSICTTVWKTECQVFVNNETTIMPSKGWLQQCRWKFQCKYIFQKKKKTLCRKTISAPSEHLNFLFSREQTYISC